MSSSLPAGDGGRTEKIMPFVSRPAVEHWAESPSDDVNAFSTEAPAPSASPALRPRRTRLVLMAVLAPGAVGALVAVAFLAQPWFLARSAADLPAQFARATFSTSPVGVGVTIDGQPRGLTPLTVQLAPGSHTVVFRQGGIERTIDIQLAPGTEVTQRVEFAPDVSTSGRSTLLISTDPPGARVIIDGDEQGVSPLTVTGLAAAHHRVTVVSETGSLERVVETPAGTSSSVVFSLPKAPLVSAGWLSIVAPFEVQVIERGEVLGTTASAKILMSAGTHETSLVNKALGYEEHRRVEIRPGATATLAVDARAPLSVNARPWAEVLLDGRPIGQTPIANLPVELGSHQIVFRNPQLGDQQKLIVVTATGPNRVAVDLMR